MTHSFGKLALAAALLLVAVPETFARRASTQSVQAQDDEWRRLVERDVEVVFDASVSVEPSLMRFGETEWQRAAAIYAVAVGGDARARASIAGLHGKVEGIERVAVIFALAALEKPPLDILLDLSRLGDPTLAPTLAAALALSDDVDAQVAIGRFEGPATLLGPAIAATRAYRRDPAASARVPELEPLLELRFQAAARFGRIGGEPWRARRLRELAADEEWLEDLILPLGAAVDRPWTRDHLVTALLEDADRDVCTAAVRYLGPELVQLVNSNIWVPQGEEGWTLLLDAIEASDEPSGFAGVLTRAASVDTPPPIARRAACMLYAIGMSELSDTIVRDLLDSEDPVDRRAALRAIADGPIVEGHEFFEPFVEEQDGELRAIAAVAIVLRAQGVASEKMRQLIVDDASLRPLVVAELTRRSRVPSAVGYLALAINLPGLPPQLQMEARVALARAGLGTAAESLYKSLAGGADGPVAAEALAALAQRDEIASARLASEALLFSRDPRLAIVAGRVLIAQRDPLGQALLRRALWVHDVASCQLAAGYLIDTEGMAALEIEIESAPIDVRDSDLRRLAIALGEWGGYGTVERLARTRTLRDPVLQGAYLGALASRTR